MQVQIKGEEKDIYVQTITLQPETGGNLYGFHCVNCGNFHQKIGGKVSKIYPVYEPSDQVPVVSKCRNCGSEYTFQTHDGYSTEEIKVVLHPRAQTDRFYCYRGKDLLLEYTDTKVLTWEKVVDTPPFSLACKNPDCDLIYFISDIF